MQEINSYAEKYDIYNWLPSVISVRLYNDIAKLKSFDERLCQLLAEATFAAVVGMQGTVKDMAEQLHKEKDFVVRLIENEDISASIVSVYVMSSFVSPLPYPLGGTIQC